MNYFSNFKIRLKNCFDVEELFFLKLNLYLYKKND